MPMRQIANLKYMSSILIKTFTKTFDAFFSLEQFSIFKLILISLFGLDLSVTNSTLFTLFLVSYLSFFLILSVLLLS